MVKIADISSKPNRRKKAKTINTLTENPDNSTKDRIVTTEKNWQHIAKMLKEFACEPDFYIVEEFYINLDIPGGVFYHAVKNFECMREANEYAVTRAGINREKLAIKRGESINSTNSFMLPAYLSRVKDQIQWRQQLKQELLDNVAKSMTGLKPEDVMGNL